MWRRPLRYWMMHDKMQYTNSNAQIDECKFLFLDLPRQ